MKKIFILLSVVFVIFGIGFFGCGEKILAPTNITYDGTKIRWNKVALAENYTVQINNGEPKKTNTNSIQFANSTNEEFDVTISAIVKSKAKSTTKHFIPLKTIENILIDEKGCLSWEPIPNATNYRVMVNNSILLSDLTETHFEPNVGNNSIKIRAVLSNDDGFYSFWSEPVSVFVNSSPTKIIFDGEKLSWLGNSSNYLIKINEMEEEIFGNEYIPNINGGQDFSVEIKSLGDHITSFDSKICKEEFHYLKQITNLIMEEGILYWDNIDNAKFYKLKINDIVQNVRLNKPCFENITVGVLQKIQVMPINETGNYFSTWSSVKKVFILDTPITTWNSNLDLDGEANNNYTWNSVNGAVGYSIEIEKNGNKVVEDFTESQVSFASSYAEIGIYKLRIKAKAEAGTDYYDSKYSDIITINRLSAPQPINNDYIKSNDNDLKAGFTVSYKPVIGAIGYQLYKGNPAMPLEGKYTTTLSISDNDVTSNSTMAQEIYEYKIRAIGGVKTISGKTYVTLPTLTENALSFSITVLAMPTNLDMSGYNAKWNTVLGNNGFTLSCNGIHISANTNLCDLSILETGNYEVNVCANGNGSNVLASNYSTPLKINRLAYPTNLSIIDNNGEGKLQFNSVSNAKSYDVYIDGNLNPLPENAFDNMYQYISTMGTTITMVAVANTFNESKTIYYMTSTISPTSQFVKLEAPIFPENSISNNTQIKWNKPSNINLNVYTPTYEIYEHNVRQIGGQINGTTYSMDYLKGGIDYEFTVKAIGNNVKYLNSHMSNIKSFHKLATPNLIISDNKYTWQSILNASSYVLEIDSVRVTNEFHIADSTYSFTPSFSSIGNHTIKLWAVGDGNTTINSNVYTFTQKVKQLTSPEFSCKYSNQEFVTGGSIIANITKQTPYANGYLYEIAGETISLNALTCSKIIESVGNYVVKVKALGGMFDNENTYYIDSQFVGGNSLYQIILLPSPNLSSLSISADGVVMWASVNGSLGYDYCISFDDKEFLQNQHCSGNRMNIENFTSYKTIKIKLKATGNNLNIIDSQWIEFIWTNPNR